MTDRTTESPVLLLRHGGVAVVRLNRPDAMNALDVTTKETLLETLRSVAEDETVRCVVLTGAGRAFCVGQDLKEHVQQLEREQDGFALGATVRAHYNPIVELLTTMDKPVIAAVNGVAAGAGASFAFAADLRILSESAGFNMAFTGIALSCDSGASFALPRLVGTARAKELLLRPRTLSAQESLALGLATEVVPDDELESHVSELAATLASGPTRAYGAVRRAVAYSAGHPLTEALAHEAELMNDTGASADHRAAVAAFLAKEKPVFEGR
ncbi:MAG TPA: enoyl-CoA hydratase-related protein [Ornithinicoccus sp.]|nr:enoyl-CoA hydratase-related protein [Ornithinicoccus sp.]